MNTTECYVSIRPSTHTFPFWKLLPLRSMITILMCKLWVICSQINSITLKLRPLVLELWTEFQPVAWWNLLSVMLWAQCQVPRHVPKSQDNSYDDQHTMTTIRLRTWKRGRLSALTARDTSLLALMRLSLISSSVVALGPGAETTRWEVSPLLSPINLMGWDGSGVLSLNTFERCYYMFLPLSGCKVNITPVNTLTGPAGENYV